MAVEPERSTGDGPTRAAVEERLDRVDDPELDRSIVELEYVDRIEIDGGHVEVTFVLPTAWCSPAFAWMMATGIRDEVGSLESVESVSVELRDHMHAAEINHGVAAGLPFEEAFSDAEDGIEAVREKLDEKARLARQFEAFDALLEAGMDPDQITDLRRGDLDLAYGHERAAISLRNGGLSLAVPREPLVDYLEKAQATDLVTGPEDRLFADRDRHPIDPTDFEVVRRDSRLAVANIEGQGAICSALHESRNDVSADD